MTIALRKNYTTMLDEVLKNASLTSVLDSDASVVKEGNQIHEILVPKMTMDALADVDRGTGNLVDGSVSLEYETKAFNFLRGRRFVVSQVDNEETADIAFGKLASEFVRTQVVPEKDAFCFAKIAGTTGISKVAQGATLSTGADVVAALAAAMDGMDNDEVPAENRHLFITPALLGLVRDMDTTKSKEILASFASITKVPQSRFYTAIDQADGTSTGETGGGYSKASAGKDINFLIVYKPAIMKFDKQVASDIITPQENQHGYGWVQKYMNYGIVEVYDNKVKGIYLHHKA
jgi:hypothetical protein